MKKKSIFLILVILCLFFSTPYAMAELEILNDKLYFGQITASSETVKQIILYYPIQNDSTNVLEIWVDDDLYCQKQNTVIPKDRLSIEANNIIQVMESTPINIWLDQEITEYYPLSFNITVLPNDLPGIYKTNLHIREIYKDEDQNVSHIFTYDGLVLVEVNSWIVLTQNIDKLKLDFINNNEGFITHDVPYTIQIASNTSWELYASLNNDFSLSESTLENIIAVKLEPSAEGYYETLFSKSAYLTYEPILVAAGSNTLTTNGYQVDIPLMLKISNYIKMLAGNFDFSIFFRVTESSN